MITTIIAASVSTVCIVTAIRSAWNNRDLKDELKDIKWQLTAARDNNTRVDNEIYMLHRHMNQQKDTIETLKEALRDNT